MDVKLLAIQQGVDAWSGSHPPTKTLPFHGDMAKGRLCHVPASFSDMGCDQPKNHHAISKFPCFQCFRFARSSQSVNLFRLALVSRTFHGPGKFQVGTFTRSYSVLYLVTS